MLYTKVIEEDGRRAANIMAEKQEVKDFLLQLLTEHGCKGVHVSNDDIHCACPFHNPRKNTTAFGVSFTKETEGYPFHCLSCDVAGNIIRLISHLMGYSFRKAQKYFEKRVISTPINLKILKSAVEKLSKADAQYKKVEEIEFPFKAVDQSAMIEYLEKRNRREHHGLLDIEYLIKKYCLYLCLDGRYRNRIIMPIRNLRGEFVQINDRTIKHNARNKSLHSKDTDFIGLMHGVYESLDKRKVVVVEGAFDMFQVMCALREKREFSDFGCINVMGNRVQEEKAAILCELFEEVYVLFDNEKSGRKPSWESTELLSEYMPAFNITPEIPWGKDPGVCTAQQIRKAIRNVGSGGYKFGDYCMGRL